MSKRNTFSVVDTRGDVHTRTSNVKVYTHAVAIHWAPRDPFRGRTEVEWASSLALAQKNYSKWYREQTKRIGTEMQQIAEVEILDVMTNTDVPMLSQLMRLR